MDKITSIEQYKEIKKKNQEQNKPIRSNCCLSLESVERYIRLERFYVEYLDEGIAFLSDEERYYKCYFFINKNSEINVCAKDKPILIENMYQADRKDEEFDKRLEKAGFVKQYTGRQLETEPEEVLKRLRIPKAYLNNKGSYKVCELPPDRAMEMVNFLDGIDEIPYYRIDYETEEELKKVCERGQCYCVMDSQNKICAMERVFTCGRFLYDWIAVEKEYRVISGMAVILTAKCLEYAQKNNLRPVGWVRIDNTTAINYDMKIGRKWTNRYVDLWMLRKEIM